MTLPAYTDTGDAPTDADLFALIGGERPSAPITVAAHDDTTVDPVLVLLKGWAAMDASEPPATPRKLTIEQMRNWTVSANAPYSISQDKAVLHQEKSNEANGVLWATARQSTKARGKGKGVRKVLRFPALRKVYARERRDLNGFSVRSGKSYGRDIWHYLVTWGYRTLNDLDGAGHQLPTADDLADLFYARIRERGQTFYPMYSNRGHGISSVDAEKMAQDAAQAVLRDWTPDWIRQQREHGATGGRNSKRAATWGDADLDRLAELEGKTIPEQAAILGYGERTISTMRAALRERLDAAVADDAVQPTPCTPVRRIDRLRALHRLARHHRPRRHQGDPHGPLRPEHDQRRLAPRTKGRWGPQEREPETMGRRRAGPTPGRSGRPHGRSTGRGPGHLTIEHRPHETRPPRPQRRPPAVTGRDRSRPGLIPTSGPCRHLRIGDVMTTTTAVAPARRGRTCDVCRLSPEVRARLEQQLAEGVSFSRISRDHGAPSRDSIRRHVASGHLAPHIADTVARAHGLDAVAVTGRIAEAAQRAREAGLVAMENGDARLALRAIDTEVRTLAALAAAGIEREQDAIMAADVMTLAKAVFSVAKADSHFADALVAELDRRGRPGLADDVFAQYQEPITKELDR